MPRNAHKAAQLLAVRQARLELERLQHMQYLRIVELADSTDASLAEIGEALGVPRQTARIRIRQAKAHAVASPTAPRLTQDPGSPGPHRTTVDGFTQRGRWHAKCLTCEWVDVTCEGRSRYFLDHAPAKAQALEHERAMADKEVAR